MRTIQKTCLLLAAAALIAVAVGSNASASNMAFKINQIIYRNSCQVCDQWLSLPANNSFAGKQFKSAGGLCDTDGDGISVGDAGDLFAFIAQQGTAADPSAIDSVQSASCLSPLGANPVYDPARGAVRVRPKGPFPQPDQNFIVVGSHAPGKQILVRTPLSRSGSGNCILCDNQVDLFYHTTYTNLRNACDSNVDGNSAPNTADQFQFVTQQGTVTNPALVDSVATVTCTSPLGANPAIRIGKALRIRTKTTTIGDIVYAPPHF